MAWLWYARRMARPAWNLKTATTAQRRAHRAALACVGLGTRQWATLKMARDTGIPLSALCRDTGISLRTAYRRLPRERTES